MDSLNVTASKLLLKFQHIRAPQVKRTLLLFTITALHSIFFLVFFFFFIAVCKVELEQVCISVALPCDHMTDINCLLITC